MTHVLQGRGGDGVGWDGVGWGKEMHKKKKGYMVQDTYLPLSGKTGLCSISICQVCVCTILNPGR